jgi:hypothetical protein
LVSRILRQQTAVIDRLQREPLTVQMSSISKNHQLARLVLASIHPGIARLIPRRTKQYIKARVLKLDEVK